MLILVVMSPIGDRPEQNKSCSECQQAVRKIERQFDRQADRQSDR